MNTKTIVLGGAAALLLVAGVSTPSLAQYVGNPPQYSTPAERAQTEQLNQQAVDGTTASPAALNGQGGELDTPSPQNQAALARYRAQQAHYQQDLERYRLQNRRYMRNVHHYRYDRDTYDYSDGYPYQ